MPWISLPRRSPLGYKSLIWLLLFAIPEIAAAQWVKQIPAIQNRPVEAAGPFTAVVVVLADVDPPHTLNLRVDGQLYEVLKDEDAPVPSFFLSLEGEHKHLSVDCPNPFDLYLINSGVVPATESQLRFENEHCYDFEAVSQASWRAGLPSPAFDRVANSVRHLVVHHTAGSNSNTNYTQVVRDIYLFHTQVNGWSDIGYNFLVAQDGTIFEGRDPGSDLTEYEVLGAHFCAKNSGTLGVAMLGNFETAQPTTAAVSSLSQVLASAADRFDLNVLGSAQHRGQELNHIAGHRDGCATLCPGEHLYAQLADLRSQTSDLLDNCNELPEDPVVFNLYPNPVQVNELLTIESPDSVRTVALVHLNGGNVRNLAIDQGQIALTDVQRGLYLLYIEIGQSQVVRKLAVR